jgi:hypothetical protein
MYPLSILWHWGAQALPRGELDDEGRSATEEALVVGNPRSSGPAI